MQEVSGGTWLQFAMGHCFESRLLKTSIFDQNSDDCVQAFWQGPFFSEITRPWNLGMCFGDFGPKSGLLCAGFLAGFFFSEITRPWNLGMCFGDFGPISGRRRAGFLAEAFLFSQK